MCCLHTLLYVDASICSHQWSGFKSFQNGDGSCFGRELSYVVFSREHCLLALLREKLSF